MADYIREMVDQNRKLEQDFAKERLGEQAVKEEGDIPTEEPTGEIPAGPGAEEKVFVGSKGDEIMFYLIKGDGDMKIIDGEDNEIISAKADGIDTTDEMKALAELLAKVDMDLVDYKIFMQFAAAEEEEEKAEEPPAEPPAEEPPAEEPKGEADKAAEEGKEPAKVAGSEADIVKALLEGGNYDVLASAIVDKDIAEDIAKVKEAHVVEDLDDAFGHGKGKFVVIKGRAAVKEAEAQPTVPPQKGEDPTKGAKMGATGGTETQPTVPPQKGEDPTKGAKPGATGQVETQPVIPPQKGEEVTKGPETTSAKDAEKEEDLSKLTPEARQKKKDEDEKKKKDQEKKDGKK